MPPPESTPPGRWAPLQLATQGRLREPPRGRVAVARGEGLRDAVRVLSTPRVKPLTTVPIQQAHCQETVYLRLRRFQHRTPVPRDPDPSPLQPYARAVSTTVGHASAFLLSPCLSWAVHSSTPRPHLKGQRYTGT